MAWTSPITWVAGQVVTAAELNQQVSDNLNFLHSPPRVKVYQTATTSLTSGATTALPFDTEDYDTDGMHSITVNTTRITCVTAGLYFLAGSVGYAGNATGYRYAVLQANGATVVARSQAAAAPVNATVIQVAGYYSLTVGDYVELLASQSSGGALSTSAGDSYTSMSAQWVAAS